MINFLWNSFLVFPYLVITTFFIFFLPPGLTSNTPCGLSGVSWPDKSSWPFLLRCYLSCLAFFYLFYTIFFVITFKIVIKKFQLTCFSSEFYTLDKNIRVTPLESCIKLLIMVILYTVTDVFFMCRWKVE